MCKQCVYFIVMSMNVINLHFTFKKLQYLMSNLLLYFLCVQSLMFKNTLTIYPPPPPLVQGGYNLKPDKGLTIQSMRRDLNFLEGLKPFTILRGLLHSVFRIFRKRKKAFQLWNKFSPERKLCLLKTAGSGSVILIFQSVFWTFRY